MSIDSRSIPVLAICTLTILCFSCKKEKTRFEKLESSYTGIHFANSILEKDSFNIMHNEYMYNGGGVGVGDLNLDGLPDLIFTGNKVASRIYLNRGDMHFEDITETAIGLDSSQWISGVAMADVNADGLVDLYFTSTTSRNPELRKNQLWIHQGMDTQGKPKFENKAAEYGLDDTGYGVHAAFLDYDLDGDLDVYILNNITNREVPTNYRPKIIDGSAQNNDKLYRNNGNGKFEDVTIHAGIVYEGFGLGLAIGDVNKDGYPDIYVSNDYVANDILYINQKNGTFKNMTKDLVSYQSRFSMGNDMADINNDAFQDIMTTDMMPESYGRKKQTINGNSYNNYVYNEKYGYEPQYVRNMLHVHNGLTNGEMIPYSEIGQMAGIFQTEWSWSPLFADYDNDGDKDLLVTNGFPKDLTDKDFTNYKAQVYGYLVGDYDIIPKIPIVKVSNYAFENTGNLRFRDVTKGWGMSIPSFSNGAAFSDLDNDGDLDYITSNINDPAFVYRNHTMELNPEKHHFLKIKLLGTQPNTQGLGAKVSVWTKNGQQYFEQFLSRGYISSIDPVIHTGLDTISTIDSVVVIWPGHKARSVIYRVNADQMIEIKQSEAKSLPDSWLWPQDAQPLFRAQNDIINYTHLQSDYIDFFQMQNILPHKFSQAGPCMAKGDINGDSTEDLIVGGNLESATAVYLQRNGQLIRADIPGLTDMPACLQTDMILVDIDNDQDLDLLSVSGGYANEKESDYRHILYRNQKGKFVAEDLPCDPFIASVVRQADIDNDGDKDIFIGSRVKRSAYPTSSPSVILINENGKFSKEKIIVLDLGMTTDAQWADLNQDGWMDLMVSREWNTPMLLLNQKGTAFLPDASLQKPEYSGLWYSVLTGDFDKDGDSDIVLGNLGQNHRFTISPQYPLRTYALDIDNNGQLDPITAGYWPDSTGAMKEYPVNYLDELAAQSPFFRKKFTSYTQFSKCTMEEILQGLNVEKSSMPAITTTSSAILWNEGEKGFQWQELPAWTQVAPIKKMISSDVNNDGLQDIIMAGNDHSYDVSTGNFDACRGLVLLNQGNQKFDVIRSGQSGLNLTGQAESMMEFKLNQVSYLFVAINRKSIKTFQIHPLETKHQ